MEGKERRDDIIRTIGKAGLSALFPNDFEYYALTLELVDSMDRTVRYLTFPISPDSMTYDNVQVASVKKTMGGVSSLDNETFTPKNINIAGTFGRNFKLLISPPRLPNPNIPLKPGLGKIDIPFSPLLKTGYGTMKYLEKMINESSQLDQLNQPYRLYLYNPALGQSFWVKAMRHTITQDKSQNNMMWKYDIQLTALSTLDAVSLKGLSMGESLLMASLQKIGNDAMNVAKAAVQEKIEEL